MKPELEEKVHKAWHLPASLSKKDSTNNIFSDPNNPDDLIVKLSQLSYNISRISETNPFIVTSNNSDSKQDILTNGEEPMEMDNNDLLLKLIDKVEESNKQLKNDIAESEKRNAADRKEREERIEQQRKLSEERMEKKFSEAMDAIKYQNKNINSFSEKVDRKIDNMSNKLDSTNKWIMGLCLTTITGIAAMVITIIVSR